jgi:hypothetical protein
MDPLPRHAPVPPAAHRSELGCSYSGPHCLLLRELFERLLNTTGQGRERRSHASSAIRDRRPTSVTLATT